jgi:hypothetical protein
MMTQVRPYRAWMKAEGYETLVLVSLSQCFGVEYVGTLRLRIGLPLVVVFTILSLLSHLVV